MKKKIMIVFAAILVAVQMSSLIFCLADLREANLVATYNTLATNEEAQGFTASSAVVQDNVNFNAAINLNVTDFNLFYSKARALNIYSEENRKKSIAKWAASSEAEMCFWVKTPAVNFTVKLNGSFEDGEKSIEKAVSLPGSDKWQEIRIKRQEFTDSADFNDAVKGNGQVTLQLITEKADGSTYSFIDTNNTFYISEVRFYDGKIQTAVDSNGGTIDLSQTKGKIIADFAKPNWRAETDVYRLSDAQVTDNIYFTKAMSLEILSNSNLFAGDAKEIQIYDDSNANNPLNAWAAADDYAELRFWVKTSKDATFDFQLMGEFIKDGGYSYPRSGKKTITLTASDKWQEIRIKKSDLDAGGLCTNILENSNHAIYVCLFAGGTGATFIGEGDNFLISSVRFYDGYIPDIKDPNGGSIIVVPIEGVEIADFAKPNWRAETDVYRLSDAQVTDNIYFTKAMSLEILSNSNLFAGDAKEIQIYDDSNTNNPLNAWAAAGDYAELRFWVKTSKNATFDFQLMGEFIKDGGYSYLRSGKKTITLTASDKWQEIRIKKSDLDAGGLCTNILENSNHAIYVCLFAGGTGATFTGEGDNFLISSVRFYDGYVSGDIDPNGGTIDNPAKPGTVIGEFNNIAWNDSAKPFSLQSSSVHDNSNFTSATSVTVKNNADMFSGTEKEIQVYSANNSIVSLNKWAAVDYSELQFWVKTSKNATFDFQLMGEYITPTGVSYSRTDKKTITLNASDKWQEIRIKKSELNAGGLSNGILESSNHNIYVCLLAGGTGATFIGEGDEFLISSVRFYDGYIDGAIDPEGGTIEDTEKDKVGKLVAKVELNPLKATGLSLGRTEVSSNKNFSEAVSVQVVDGRYFNEESWRVFLRDSDFDITEWYNSSNGYVRFWVKSSKTLNYEVGFRNPEADDASSYAYIGVNFVVNGSDKWQEVRISVRDFPSGSALNPAKVRNIEIWAKGDTAPTTNETVYFSDFEFYDGLVPADPDANGGTIGTDTNNAVVNTFSVYTPSLIDDGKVDVKYVVANTNKYFSRSARFVAFADTDFEVRLKNYPTPLDISRGRTGTFRLWVKSSEKNTFNVILTDKNSKKVTLKFTAEANADNWQELRAELSEITSEEFDFSQLVSVLVKGSLKDSTAIEIGKAELWKNKLTTPIEVEGGTVSPPLKYPPEWDELPTMPDTEENRIFAQTTGNPWCNDWMSGNPQSIVAGVKGLEDGDSKLSWFVTYTYITMKNPDYYYNHINDVTYYVKPVADVSPYLKTGTLRFWVNVPKDMTLKLKFTSVDENGKYTDTIVPVDIKKIAENDGWQEIQVPLKSLYDNANEGWDPYDISMINISGPSAEEFLATDETIYLSHFEFWKGEALEPEPYDPTTIYNSMNGKLYVKDINKVLSKTSMVNGFKNTLEKDKYKNIVTKYFDGAGFITSYTAQIVSASDYDYSVVKPYDNVWLYVPLTDELKAESFNVSVVNSTGIHQCKYIVEGNYISIETTEFGEFLFTSGGKRNTIEFDDEDILRNTDNNSSDNSSTSYDSIGGGDDGEEEETVIKKVITKVKKKKNNNNNNIEETSTLPIVIVVVSGAVLVAGGIVTLIVLAKKGIIFKKGRIIK